MYSARSRSASMLLKAGSWRRWQRAKGSSIKSDTTIAFLEHHRRQSASRRTGNLIEKVHHIPLKPYGPVSEYGRHNLVALS